MGIMRGTIIPLLIATVLTSARAQSVAHCDDAEVKNYYGDVCNTMDVKSCDTNAASCPPAMVCCQSALCTGTTAVCVPVRGGQTPPAQIPPAEGWNQLCGQKPHSNQSFEARTTPVTVPAVDVMVKAQAKQENPVIDVNCDGKGSLTTSATLGDIFSSLATSFNTSVSNAVESPLDETCLPHVLGVYVRPWNISNLVHPTNLLKDLNKNVLGGKLNGPNGNATFKRVTCSLSKGADADFSLDDELLAVVPLDASYRVKGNPLTTPLKFLNGSCSLCGNQTLIIRADPLGLLNDTNPCNNYLVFNVTFNCNIFCQVVRPQRTKLLYNLHPDKNPVLKVCNSTMFGGSTASVAKLGKKGISWKSLTRNKLAFREGIRFPLAADIMEMLHGDTCPKCANVKQDSCPSSPATTDLAKVDITAWQKFVTIAYNYALKTMDDPTDANTTVECIFKKLKLAADTNTCPFRKNMIPKLYQMSYDKCMTSNFPAADARDEVFDDDDDDDEDYDTEQMAHEDFLSAIVHGLCGKEKGKKPKQETAIGASQLSPPAGTNAQGSCAKKNAVKFEATNVIQNPSCYVDILRNLFRENKNIREKAFLSVHRDAMSRMAPDLLSKRINATLQKIGINASDLFQSSLYPAIKNLDLFCKPEPSAPSCAKSTKQLIHFEKDNTIYCGIAPPTGSSNDTVCASPCAVKICPNCTSRMQPTCSWRDFRLSQDWNQWGSMSPMCRQVMDDVTNEAIEDLSRMNNMGRSLINNNNNNNWLWNNAGGSNGSQNGGNFFQSVRGWNDLGGNGSANWQNMMNNMAGGGSDALQDAVNNVADIGGGPLQNAVNNVAGIGSDTLQNAVNNLGGFGQNLNNFGNGNLQNMNPLNNNPWFGRKKRDINEVDEALDLANEVEIE